MEKSHDFVDSKKSALQLLSYQHVGSLMLSPNQECIVILRFLAVKGRCIFYFYSLYFSNKSHPLINQMNWNHGANETLKQTVSCCTCMDPEFPKKVAFSVI